MLANAMAYRTNGLDVIIIEDQAVRVFCLTTSRTGSRNFIIYATRITELPRGQIPATTTLPLTHPLSNKKI